MNTTATSPAGKMSDRTSAPAADGGMQSPTGYRARHIRQAPGQAGITQRNRHGWQMGFFILFVVAPVFGTKPPAGTKPG